MTKDQQGGRPGRLGEEPMSFPARSGAVPVRGLAHEAGFGSEVTLEGITLGRDLATSPFPQPAPRVGGALGAEILVSAPPRALHELGGGTQLLWQLPRPCPRGGVGKWEFVGAGRAPGLRPYCTHL